MHNRCVWLALSAILLAALIGCSAKYRTRPLTEEEPVPDGRAERIVAHADSLYSIAVEYFVAEKYDSAGYHLNGVISYLSRDIDWAADEKALGERRILLYKCRYFLERIPGAQEVIPPHELELAAVEPKKPPLPSVEIVDNAKVRTWIEYFCGRGRATFDRWVKRSGQYRMTTLKILKEEGMPLELVNLALIESGFNPNAYSRAHAVGMWQFIRSTARLYGMRVDWWVDERRDPVRSTRAASRYLRDLHTALGDWELAMAAYNTGQRGVERAMKRSRSDDYWELSLPRETRDYVPKFMAACIIMNSPGAYGFEFEYDDPIDFEEIRVAPKTSLTVIAKCAGADAKAVTEMNPHLIRECAPDGTEHYGVRIPRGTVDVCRANLAEIPAEERVAQSYASPYMKHTVKSGESLSVIARKYGTSISTIAQANGISNYHRIAAGQVLTIPYGDAAPLPENPGVHVVRRGETLTSVAHRYGLRVNDIAAWNDLRSRDLIYPGQQLIVSLDHAVKPPPTVSPEGAFVHVVSRGETVSAIAARYGASCDEVLRTNGMNSRDMIYPGQQLKIPGGGPGKALVHTVRKGDTISEIASRYGVSTSSVLEANAMDRNDRIYPGQQLRISGGADQVTVHTVKRGDTIYDIARAYGVPTSSVLAANCMGPRDPIYPGEKIKVPAGGVRDEIIVHSVRSGDTITGIAKKYGATSGEVLKENGLGPRDKIYPGQKIRVPVRRKT